VSAGPSSGPANGWTGGQYSIYRAILGLYLLQHFVTLLPWSAEVFSSRGALPDGSASPLLYLFPNVLALWDAPAVVSALLILAAVLSVFFAAGKFDRIAAVGILYVLACLFGRNPLIANPSLPYVGWLLLAHAFLPPAPYGSWAARDRAEPSGGWQMPREVFVLAWILMALGYSYSGFTKLVSRSWVDGSALQRVLENPLARPGLPRDVLLAMPDSLLTLATWGALGLELVFAPLALFRRVRPWLWLAMLLLHINLMLVINFADLSFGMIILHLFTFDPAWVRPLRAAGEEMLFYDGHCGLCHRAVRFVLAEDSPSAPAGFRFAPLDGEFFRSAVPEAERAALPDSLVLRTAGGRLWTRSAGVRHLLMRLGGMWRVLGWVMGLVPARILDAAYDFVARIRYRLFPRPVDACPMVPRHLRARFHL
jgi:predicted DCC family thiol-disulfide oxidoreductase YuxK